MILWLNLRSSSEHDLFTFLKREIKFLFYMTTELFLEIVQFICIFKLLFNSVLVFICSNPYNTYILSEKDVFISLGFSCMVFELMLPINY